MVNKVLCCGPRHMTTPLHKVSSKPFVIEKLVLEVSEPPLAKATLVDENDIQCLQIAHEQAREVFLPGGCLVGPGETLRQERVARTLERLRDEDMDYYLGDFARAFAQAAEYQGIMSHRGQPSSFAQALNGAYSSNPRYGSLVKRMLDQFDLFRFDRIAPPRTPDW